MATLNTNARMSAVGATSTFPRTAISVSAISGKNNSPLLLVLDQQDARSNYEMWAWVRLFAGAKIPATAGPAVGSAQIEADSTQFLFSPSKAMAAYVEALNKPDSANGKAFPDDGLRKLVASERAVASQVKDAGSITVNVSAGNDGFRGLVTSDNGAIAVGSLSFTTTYQRTSAKSTITVSEQLAAYMGGNKEVTSKVMATYEAMVAFYLPPKGAKAKVPTALGTGVVLTSVTRDDSNPPK